MKCLRVGKLRRKKVNEVQYKPERYKRIAQCTADDVDTTVGNGQTLEKGAHIGRIRRQGQVLQPNDHTHDGCARGAIDAVVVAAVCCCCLLLLSESLSCFRELFLFSFFFSFEFRERSTVGRGRAVLPGPQQHGAAPTTQKRHRKTIKRGIGIEHTRTTNGWFLVFD